MFDALTAKATKRSLRTGLILTLAGGLTAGGVVGIVGSIVGLSARSASAAGPAAVTPKTETPNEARVLSRAFSSVAKALSPSVVRIEVEVGGNGGPHADRFHGRRPGAPGPDNDGND